MSLSIFSFNDVQRLWASIKKRTRWCLCLGSVLFSAWLVPWLFSILAPLFPGEYLEFHPSLSRLDERAQVLVVGSSHFHWGLLPHTLHPATVSLSGDGLSYRNLRDVLHTHLPKLTKLRLVVLELDTIPLTYDGVLFGSLVWRMGLKPKDLSALDWRETLRARLDYFDVVSLNFVRQARVVGRGLLKDIQYQWGAKKVTHYEWLKLIGCDPKVGQWRNGLGGRMEVHLKRYRSAKKRLDLNRAALLEMVGKVLSKGIEVLLVEPPHHEAFWSRLPDEFSALRRITEASLQEQFPGLPTLRLGQDPHFPESSFFDSDHLNIEGARMFTRLVQKKILKTLSQSAPQFSYRSPDGALSGL